MKTALKISLCVLAMMAVVVIFTALCILASRLGGPDTTGIRYRVHSAGHTYYGTDLYHCSDYASVRLDDGRVMYFRGTFNLEEVE